MLLHLFEHSKTKPLATDGGKRWHQKPTQHQTLPKTKRHQQISLPLSLSLSLSKIEANGQAHRSALSPHGGSVPVIFATALFIKNVVTRNEYICMGILNVKKREDIERARGERE